MLLILKEEAKAEKKRKEVSTTANTTQVLGG